MSHLQDKIQEIFRGADFGLLELDDDRKDDLTGLIVGNTPAMQDFLADKKLNKIYLAKRKGVSAEKILEDLMNDIYQYVENDLDEAIEDFKDREKEQ